MFSLTKEKWSPRNNLGDALKEHLLFSVLYKERLKLGFMRHFGKVNVRKELTFGSCGKLWQTQPSTPTASWSTSCWECSFNLFGQPYKNFSTKKIWPSFSYLTQIKKKKKRICWAIWSIRLPSWFIRVTFSFLASPVVRPNNKIDLWSPYSIENNCFFFFLCKYLGGSLDQILTWFHQWLRARSEAWSIKSWAFWSFLQKQHLQRRREEKSQPGSYRSHSQMSESWLKLEIAPCGNKFLGTEKSSLCTP